VKHCAQARAIENECVLQAVWESSKVNNMDIQYAQSAVFTPSDLLFLVTNQSRSHPNTEMTLIVDVDLDLLKELHEARSVSLKIAELI
jgi:predicted amidohydrolase